MNKTEALKRVIERKKEEHEKNFEHKVEDLVWAIEEKSQELRELKKQLTELQYKDVNIPDVKDCLSDSNT